MLAAVADAADAAERSAHQTNYEEGTLFFFPCDRPLFLFEIPTIFCTR